MSSMPPPARTKAPLRTAAAVGLQHAADLTGTLGWEAPSTEAQAHAAGPDLAALLNLGAQAAHARHGAGRTQGQIEDFMADLLRLHLRYDDLADWQAHPDRTPDQVATALQGAAAPESFPTPHDDRLDLTS